MPPGNGRRRLTETRSQRVRRIVSDIAAIVLIVAAMFLLGGAILLLASMIGGNW